MPFIVRHQTSGLRMKLAIHELTAARKELRNGMLRDFGVRVSPSGRKRFFIHCQHPGRERSGLTEGGSTPTAGLPLPLSKRC